MTANLEPALARRYLLGQVTEDERAALEQDYLADEQVLDRIAAAEDDLIEDYLGDQLGQVDHARFESFYLPVPHHRVRVETVRRLVRRAAPEAPARPGKVVRFPGRSAPRFGMWLALAASLVAVASLSLQVSRSSSRQSVAGTTTVSSAPPAASAATPLPRVFALTLSPVAVRGASDSPAVVIPAGVDVVSITLEADADNRALVPTRAEIRSVAGAELWRGPVAAGPLAPGSIARVEARAALPPDDYLVTLYGSDAAGAEHESNQYFMRVRSR